MSFYFRNVPDFEYVTRSDALIGRYTRVKNLFKRAKIRDDIFGNLTFFEKYKIIGDERPDNVALKFYGDETLDWVVLLSNNMINIYSEWPLSQSAFDNYLMEKYGTYDKIYEIHHYETVEVRNVDGGIIVPAGLIVDENFSISYFDPLLDADTIQTEITVPVRNYDIEEKRENEKRNIFVLKPPFLGTVLDDIDSIMPYKKGSTQFITKNLKRGDNIKIYQ